MTIFCAQFFTNENVYFKSKRCLELDNRYGDFEAEIVKHEMAILLSASNAVIKQSDALIKGIELAGSLDA